MNISRKEFFRKSLMSLGEAVFSVSDALKAPEETPPELPATADFEATPLEDQVAVPRNEHCLARNSGCFACMERCEPDAIRLIPGVGIRINRQRCSGCGTCEYVCPVTPKGVCMEARGATRGSTGLHAELSLIQGGSPD